MHATGQSTCRCTKHSPSLTGPTSGNACSHVLGIKNHQLNPAIPIVLLLRKLRPARATSVPELAALTVRCGHLLVPSRIQYVDRSGLPCTHASDWLSHNWGTSKVPVGKVRENTKTSWHASAISEYGGPSAVLQPA